MQSLSSDKGTYVLFLHLGDSTPLVIGKLGVFDFSAGWYGYVGSAFGRGGLQGRLKHHLTPVNKPHWHIDYLRNKARVKEIGYIISETVYEHTLANVLLAISDSFLPALRFGASDCKCKAHLIGFSKLPDYDEISKLVGISFERFVPERRN
jgi:Uri superfamily endonuclease